MHRHAKVDGGSGRDSWRARKNNELSISSTAASPLLMPPNRLQTG
uniref:Uncharacterized protein n=1 Tax=Anguilla anguilla TaxID=7936 RepID=A0A0E9PEK7_ANGAN